MHEGRATVESRGPGRQEQDSTTTSQPLQKEYGQKQDSTTSPQPRTRSPLDVAAMSPASTWNRVSHCVHGGKSGCIHRSRRW
jgi:hypothetical protein